MKCSFIVFLLFTVVFSFSSHAQETTKKNKKTKGGTGAQNMTDLPYKAGYSSDFTMGNMENAKMILLLYKDFENQVWTKDGWFADTVTVIIPNGTVIKGKDSVLNAFKKQRAGLSSTSFTMDAIIPLKSQDRDQDWVALWGHQQMTLADNTAGSTSVDFQTIWGFNREKKIVYVHFYEAQPSRQQ
jgi:hypothetical protein